MDQSVMPRAGRESSGSISWRRRRGEGRWGVEEEKKGQEEKQVIDIDYILNEASGGEAKKDREHRRRN